MRWYSKFIISAMLSALLSTVSWAQSNICQPSTPNVPNEARAELLRIQAEERARQEAARVTWTATIIPLKNAVSPDSLRVLCIFGIEVAPQSTQRLVAVRAPKELMPAVEEALKRLDVPQPVAKNVEMTGYVLLVSEESEPTMMPVPEILRAAVTQLKSVLPNGNVYLADTVVVRGTVGNSINVMGNTTLSANVINLREGTPPIIRLEGFRGSVMNARFDTSVEIPVGSQVVVGKATATAAPAVGPVMAPPPGGYKSKAVVLVMTARLLD